MTPAFRRGMLIGFRRVGLCLIWPVYYLYGLGAYQRPLFRREWQGIAEDEP